MTDFTFEAVAQKSVKGIFALISRTFLLQILSIVASFILTVYLSEESFGIFFVVSSIIIFFNYFQDIGLAASLIQKKEEPSLKEYRTAFTFQQVLVLLLIIPALFFSKDIAGFYELDNTGHILLISLLASFFLTSLRTIPTVMLERRLEFKRLVMPQIGENLAYNIALIVLALQGAEVMSFAVAVFVRSVVGLVLTYIIQPWHIGFSFDKDAFKRLVSYGVPFQTNSILALLKDDLLTIYLGKVLTFSQLGYIGFAQKWAFLPLRLVMDNVIKITFPSYSRLQHDTAALKIAIEKSLFLVSTFIFPTAFGLIILSPYFIDLVPRYEKWQPALISLAFFALNTVFSSISTPLTNFLNAIGKVKITLYFMAFWTAATWILTFILINAYGYNGVAAASFLISLTSIGVILIARRYVAFSLVRPIVRQFIASILMAGFIFLTKDLVIHSLPLLFVEAVLAGLFYSGVLFIMAKEEILSTGRFIISSIRK